MPRIFPRFLLTFCLFCLALAPVAGAERKVLVGTAPPQPVDMNLKVRRDGKTEIPLRIVGKAGEPLKYLIRVPPEHGRLSEPRPTEREVSTVIYEPPADLSITTDKFSYAVENSLGVSAAVDVSITIVDDPPQLAFPDALDFAKIRAGATNYKLLEISNHGGMIATGEVFVDPPWKIVGKNGYRLRAGDVAVFKIVFSPEVGGEFEGVARYTSEPEHSTTLRGVAAAAISANPARWVLRQTPGDYSSRTGTFELASDLDEPRTLHLKADPRLKIPAELTLPAHGTCPVPVEASPSNVEAFETEIHLETPELSINIPVVVPALAAIVRPVTPAVIFGRVPSGPDASARFELENVGGTPGAVSWEVGPPFKATENSATLQPGEKKSFVVEIDTTAANKYRTWLHFKTGAQSFDLPVEAEVIGAPKRTPPPTRAPSVFSGNPSGTPSVAAAPPTPSPEEVQAALLALRDSLNPELLPVPPPPKGVRVGNIKPTSAVVEWPATLSPASHFRIETRLIGHTVDHKLEIKWAEVYSGTVETRVPNYAYTLKNLAPAQPCTIRVRPLKGTAEVGPPLFTVTFVTPPKPSYRPHPTMANLLGLLVLTLVVLVSWQIWNRTRPQSIF